MIEDGVGGSGCVEATPGALDQAHAEEIVEGALDLENGGVWRLGVKGGNGDGVGGSGDDVEEMLEEEATMQRVGTILDQVSGLQSVGSVESNIRSVWSERLRLDLEDEGRGKGGMTVDGVAQEETIRLSGIRREQEAADSLSQEMVGSFQDGGFCMATFGGTVADEEAGDVALDELQVEICEEMGETHVGDAHMA